MPADLVLRNGKIVIVEGQWPHVSALAITGDRIVAIGSDRVILKFYRQENGGDRLKGNVGHSRIYRRAWPLLFVGCFSNGTGTAVC